MRRGTCTSTFILAGSITLSVVARPLNLGVRCFVSPARLFFAGSVVALASHSVLGQPTALVSEFSLSDAPKDLCQFQGDAERVEVRDGGKIISALTFCSAYGGASAKVATDRAGVSFLLLRFGEGHGTNARSEYLSVYRVAPTLDEYVRLPISGPSSPVDRWAYTYEVSQLPERGIRIVLWLHHGDLRHVEGHASSGHQRHAKDGDEYYPGDAMRVVEVGAGSSP